MFALTYMKQDDHILWYKYHYDYSRTFLETTLPHDHIRIFLKSSGVQEILLDRPKLKEVKYHETVHVVYIVCFIVTMFQSVMIAHCFMFCIQ